MQEFQRTTNGFNFVYEKFLSANETVIVKMPTITPNKRGINDIGWQSDGNVTLYGTLSKNPESSTALWQEILVDDEINKTVSAIKIVNNDVNNCNVIIRAILN